MLCDHLTSQNRLRGRGDFFIIAGGFSLSALLAINGFIAFKSYFAPLLDIQKISGNKWGQSTIISNIDR